MHLLVTGGGSGGHVIPTIPVMALVRDAGNRVSFVGTNTEYERRLLAGFEVEYHGIAAGKLRRYFSLANVRDAGRVLLGIWQAWRLLGRLRPDVIFSKGGFVAFPVVLAGWLRGISVVGHESDFSPGLANRLSLPFLRTLCTSFAETRISGFKGRVMHTGSPLREELLAGSAARARTSLHIADDRPVLLVTGGSLGAAVLNRVVLDALPRLLETWDVVHICGPGRVERTGVAGYHPFEFVREGWGDLLALADVVVSRAGANSLFELLTLGKLNLLVPLSAAASRGDQIENARFAAKAGYSAVVAEEAFDADSLLTGLRALLADARRYRERLDGFERPDAARAIVAELFAVLESPARQA
ncbi:MAG: UDP-N-acetylglucosamine--N-acetylmuramyl-(pentapeptide) pyrophosphoryl-undecaprenol N-acetylglucosamine transferase [Pseudomonadales bacterium]|nr:UDP-N-acetylglucosamine--N-acetylmuramyl-(pentapeptide) pyrophosphoryl-undecaprenol N-acetylglucosamine transferase [Pseudomonadales bacterium]MCP5182421.1 UDP-N-acetylglucosamine--N-acetylmuramyl-(pentapeptide) pyrophosphoryl-undecaprenol N-acetylglucosamine transferase [Pseudomonadales bacterium]